MLEDHLYWVMIYWRWLNAENFERGPKLFFKRAPAIIRPLAQRLVLRRIRRNLHGHGIGRHSESRDDGDGRRAASRRWRRSSVTTAIFSARHPCGADATVFAFVAGALAPLFESPVRDKMQSMENLVAYRDRMMTEYFPEFARE